MEQRRTAASVGGTVKITVFGGAGFLGSHVCDALSDAGHAVTVADTRPSPWLRADQRGLTADITNAADVEQAVDGADMVCNFAGIADLADADAAPVETARVNVMGNMQVLDACRRAKVRRYLFASSLYVYGRSGGFYRASKQACELFIEQYQASAGLPCTIVRYGSLYGPRADARNGLHRFVSEALRDGHVTYYGTADAQREYVHVEDAARATAGLLDDEAFAGANIVVTGGAALRIADVFRMMGEMLGRPLRVTYAADPLNGHYSMTPYAFMPRVGRKLVPPLTVDFGQGLLKLMEEIHRQQHPDLHECGGNYLL